MSFIYRHYQYCPISLPVNTNILNSSVLPIVAPIDHVYGTLDLVRALTTQQYTDRSGIREKIEGKGSFTLFAPSNEAWENLDRVSESKTLFIPQ